MLCILDLSALGHFVWIWSNTQYIGDAIGWGGILSEPIY